MTRPSPLRADPASYPNKVQILARFADVDPLWHINNVAIAQYFEEARVSTIRAMSGNSRIPATADERILIAKQTIDYVSEGNYPGALCVGIGVVRIGITSFTLGMAVFQDKRCVAVSDAVMVLANDQGPALPGEFVLSRSQASEVPALLSARHEVGRQLHPLQAGEDLRGLIFICQLDQRLRRREGESAQRDVGFALQGALRLLHLDRGGDGGGTR